MRKCKICGEIKELNGNFRSYLRKGKMYWDLACRKCNNAAQSRWRKENQAEAHAMDAAYRASHPINCRKATLKYREKHKEKRAKWKRDNQEMLWEYHREHSRKWRKENPESIIAAANKSRAKRQNAPREDVSKQQLKDLFERQRGCCAICKKKLTKKHLDHIMPLAKGGAHEIKNLQYLCPRCNVRKFCIHPIDFMQKLGFLL